MKRLIIYIVCVAFCMSLAGPAYSVEKKKKDKPKTEQKSKQPAKKPTPPPAKKPEPPKKPKYDDFVDKNKNGIDDRKENLKKKPSKSKKGSAPPANL